jgi:3-oxoacyl-[acyl-carrier protein] reductase
MKEGNLMSERRIAIVTGSGQGMGRGVAQVLAEQGHTVLLVARNADRLKKASSAINAAGGKSEAYPCDVTDRKAIATIMSDIGKKYGRVDILVNIAGMMPMPTALGDTTDEVWDAMLGANLTGTFNMIKAVLPMMLKNKFGRIINVSSVSALKAVGYFVGYAATKGGLHALTVALANEVTGQGVTVNCIAPGFTETEEMHRIWGTVAAAQGKSEEEILAGFWTQIPLARWIQPREIGKTVAFLASDDASVISGQTITIDGAYDNHV